MPVEKSREIRRIREETKHSWRLPHGKVGILLGKRVEVKKIFDTLERHGIKGGEVSFQHSAFYGTPTHFTIEYENGASKRFHYSDPIAKDYGSFFDDLSNIKKINIETKNPEAIIDKHMVKGEFFVDLYENPEKAGDPENPEKVGWVSFVKKGLPSTKVKSENQYHVKVGLYLPKEKGNRIIESIRKALNPR